MSCCVAAANGTLAAVASAGLTGPMDKKQHIQGGVDDAVEEASRAGLGPRRLSLWSHDVIVATALTVMAVSLLAAAWGGGGTRQNQAGPTTAVTQK